MSRVGCWPLPVSSNPCWATASPEQKSAAADIAAALLYRASGQTLNCCPVKVRPTQPACSCRCHGSGGWGWATWRDWDYGGGWEFDVWVDSSGNWRNGPGCFDGCGWVPEVILPSRAVQVDAVYVAGALLPSGSYELYDGIRLVRTDGNRWPHWQDVTKPLTDPNTFGVVYRQLELDAAALNAYGILAGDLVAAQINPQFCGLPEGVASAVREGVTLDFETLDKFAMTTGNVTVDRWIRLMNPQGRQDQGGATLMSPEMLRRPRNRIGPN